ncbi:hypothetical protein V6Z11_A10G213400 [Gossypium hirsutum]
MLSSYNKERGRRLHEYAVQSFGLLWTAFSLL